MTCPNQSVMCGAITLQRAGLKQGCGPGCKLGLAAAPSHSIGYTVTIYQSLTFFTPLLHSVRVTAHLLLTPFTHNVSYQSLTLPKPAFFVCFPFFLPLFLLIYLFLLSLLGLIYIDLYLFYLLCNLACLIIYIFCSLFKLFLFHLSFGR